MMSPSNVKEHSSEFHYYYNNNDFFSSYSCYIHPRLSSSNWISDEYMKNRIFASRPMYNFVYKFFFPTTITNQAGEQRQQYQQQRHGKIDRMKNFLRCYIITRKIQFPKEVSTYFFFSCLFGPRNIPMRNEIKNSMIINYIVQFNVISMPKWIFILKFPNYYRIM